MFNIENKLKQLQEESDKAAERRNFLFQHKEVFAEAENQGFNVVLTVDSWDCSRIVFKSLKDLNQVRRLIRKIYPDRRDTISSIWNPYQDLVIVSWKSPGCDVALWLETTVDEFPIKLLKPGCRLEKQIKESYVLSCELGD